MAQQATVSQIDPKTGQPIRKVVNVGDPNAFGGGYSLEERITDPNKQYKTTYNIGGVNYGLNPMAGGATTEPAYNPSWGNNPPGAETMGEENKVRYPTDEYGELLKSRMSGQKTEAEIQAEERARIQAQIDSLENYWSNTILPELQQEGQVRLGQSRGMQAVSGNLGNPMGGAQTEKTKAYTAQITRAERAKIDAQISSLYGEADKRAIDRADKQATLAREDEDAYFSYLKGQQEESRKDLETIFAGGVTLDDLKADPERYKQLLDQAGIKDEFMAEAIYNSNAPSAAKKDIKYQTVGDKVIGYYYDDATGGIKTIESESIPGLTADGKYKTQVAGGTMLLIPEKFDPNKSIESQIIQYGKTGQFRAPTGGGNSDEKDFEKIIKEYNNSVADYIEKVYSDDIDESSAVRALKAKYGEYYSEDEIRDSLGIGSSSGGSTSDFGDVKITVR
jgi:hypothetical protein